MGPSTGTKVIRGETHRYRPGNLKTQRTMAGIVHQNVIPFPSRRREARCDEQKVCVYGLCESTDKQALTIEQGEAYCLNRSEHGILILMGRQPRSRQYIELDVAETRWERSLNLYEVQWTRSIPVESQGELFLVGCWLVLGASRYWSF
ncbi:MAG: hypothetical protein OEV01_03055 [Nitrospira sp.]|jgi:hypothetical protein|nr:hypothetical protein [Nitrospira sp.]MDH4244302.1 hypothetical protein [Nitrospira sp.]MDH4357937.1 hypothetical protein [Nitrospira sp.]MDH5320129.1 hypothetical protein [Nitrospira sp.]